MLYSIRNDIIEYQLDEVILIIVTVDGFPQMDQTVQLSGVGREIWNILMQSPCTDRDICNKLSKKYTEIDFEVLKSDVNEFLIDLKNKNCIYEMEIGDTN